MTKMLTTPVLIVDQTGAIVDTVEKARVYTSGVSRDLKTWGHPIGMIISPDKYGNTKVVFRNGAWYSMIDELKPPQKRWVY